MLWDIVYDFFIQYIFGGYNSHGEYFYAFAGGLDIDPDLTTADYYVKSPFYVTGGEQAQLLLGNYLSLISTIITIVAILLFCVFIIKKIIGVMFRLFTFGA